MREWEAGNDKASTHHRSVPVGIALLWVALFDPPLEAGNLDRAWSLTRDEGMLTIAASVGLPAKKLIEFGWDEPDTSFMRKRASSSSGRRSMAVSFTCDPRRGRGPGEFHLALLGPQAILGG